jgi:hypothetical protein
MQETHHAGVIQQLLDCEGHHQFAFHWVKIQPHPGFSSIVSTNKMLYDTPEMVLLQVLMAVWMSTLR